MNTLISILLMLLTYVVIGAVWSLVTLIAFFISGWVQDARTPDLKKWDTYPDDDRSIAWTLCFALPWLWPFWLYTGIKWMWAEHKNDT
jgi:uncharacterized BrkB/YihY/UPF0761 family membrane protein